MTERKDFKRVVRDRMKETGENYTAAREAVSPSTSWTRATAPMVFAESWQEARRLGHNIVGPEHCLLAVLNGPDTAARRALRSSGLTAELVEASFGAGYANGTTTLTTNPAWYRVSGRAEGLALAGGDLAASVVVAMLWDSHSWSRWEPQIPRDSVVAALRHERVRVPDVPLPPLDRVDTFTQKATVPKEHLERVIAELARRHKTEGGPRIAFNHDGENAWVLSEAGRDLQAAVDEIVASGGDE